MKVLLDTCVLSEIRKPDGNAFVLETVANLAPEEAFVSVITLGEIGKGILQLAEGQKRRELELWFQELNRRYSDRTLSVDRDTAMIWGELTVLAERRGIQIPATDGLIAATAIQHGLHVMTRNVRHFEGCGVLIVNPWASL